MSLAVLVAALLAAAVLAACAHADVPHAHEHGEPLPKRIGLLRRHLAHHEGVVRSCARHRHWVSLHEALCRVHERAVRWERKVLALARAELRRLDRRGAVVRLARRFLGVPYVWGGTSPSGFDCSGLVQYVYARVGVYLGRTTYDQFREGTPVHGDLQPGDVVFFNGVEHEGMYIGSGYFIDAPHTGSTVGIRSLSSYGGYVGARRFL